MKRWALAILGAAAFGTAGLSFVLPAADAAIEVCAGLRANSPGTFFNLDQVECQSVGLPHIDSVGGVVDVEPVPVPPVALPDLPSAPAAAGQTGEMCVGVNADGVDAPLTGSPSSCVGFPVPPTPLPEKIVLPSLPTFPPAIPPLPVPIPALPVPIPALPV